MGQDNLSGLLRYYLIPGRPKVGSPAIEVHNLAFKFWMDHFTSAFKKNGVPERPCPDDFLRQDLISVLMHDQRVVGLHSYTFFDLNLEAARKHSYFTESFTETAMRNMDRHGGRYVMTMESLSVAPDWQRKARGVSLAVTLVCLGLRVFGKSNADMFLGTSRIDVGVARLGYEVGCLPLDTGVIVHGIPCDLQGCLRGHEQFPRGEMENTLANELWNKRLEFSGAFPESFFPPKRAAD